MREHYVTLFDYNFLPQGIALYLSMERHIKEFKLWVICIDSDVHKALSILKLLNIETLSLEDIETDALRLVKQQRTVREYCWTLSPFAPKFVFDQDPSVKRVTYLDADIWFRKPPDKIFKEFESSGKNVLITDHGYSPNHDYSEISGQYCVQFLTFTRAADNVRKWWEERCVEWCYCRAEDGKFGDQKYLEQWPILFPDDTHILSNPEWTLAPWNMGRFPFGNSVVFHFQGLRIVDDKRINLGPYPINKNVMIAIYNPYITDIRTAVNLMQQNGLEIHSQASRIGPFNKIWIAIRSLLGLLRAAVPKLDTNY